MPCTNPLCPIHGVGAKSNEAFLDFLDALFAPANMRASRKSPANIRTFDDLLKSISGPELSPEGKERADNFEAEVKTFAEETAKKYGFQMMSMELIFGEKITTKTQEEKQDKPENV